VFTNAQPDVTRTTPGITRQALVRRADNSFRLALDPRTIGAELPRLAIVLEVRVQQCAKSLMERGLLDRRDGFHATVEIARHPVGRAKIELFGAAVGELPEARMLEEPTDDADDANVVAHARQLRPQTADAAYNEVDLDTRLRRAVE